MPRHVIVIGGGQDGLAAAALLAKQGRHVVLVEARDVFGGRAAREEFHPGFFSPGLLHDTAGLRPALIDELRLVDHGLQLLQKEPDVLAPADNGDAVLRRGHDTISGASLSPGDSRGFDAWRSGVQQLTPFVSRMLDGPAPQTQPSGLGDLWELARTGLAMRKLGPATMTELLRIAPMCAHDWLDEHMQNDRLKALLAAPALGGTWLGTWSVGSAALLLMREATLGRSARGGPAAVTSALVTAAKAAGATLRSGTQVKRLVTSEGRASGVELTSGEILNGDAVLSTANPRRTLLELLGRAEVPGVLREHMTDWRVRGTTAALRLAVDGPVTFSGHDGPVARAHLADSLDFIERAFDAVKYDRISERPVLDVSVPSLLDPSLAPEGQHVVTILASFIPHAHGKGWDDSQRHALLELLISTLQRAVPEIENHILAHELLTPVDLEQRYGLPGGQLHHGEPALDQLMHLRPDPECSRHVTPIPGLWLAGSGCHPGPGLPGSSGRLAALAMEAAG